MWSLYPDAAGLFPAVAIALNDQLRRCWPTSCSDIAQVAGGGNVLFERDNAGCLGA